MQKQCVVELRLIWPIAMRRRRRLLLRLQLQRQQYLQRHESA
jgi:hypothetical protein